MVWFPNPEKRIPLCPVEHLLTAARISPIRAALIQMKWATDNSDQQVPVIVLGAPFTRNSVMAGMLPEGDAGTEQTIAVMRQLVDEAVKDPVVNRTAIDIVRGQPQFNPQADVDAIFRYVQNNFRYVLSPVGPFGGKQALRPVRSTLELRAGDCANMSVLIAALAGTIGYETKFVTVAADSSDASQFSHVYPEVLVNGQWIALDAARPGAQLGRTPEVFSRMAEWSVAGNERKNIRGLNGLGCHGCEPCQEKIPVFANSLPRNYRVMNAFRIPPHVRAQHFRGRGMGDIGDSTLAQDIGASTTGIAEIVAAGNPGSVVYGNLTSQTGQVAPLYLPGGINNVNPFGTSLVSPLGTATISPMLLLLGAGLLVLVMSRK